jgi:hypothetical protein
MLDFVRVIPEQNISDKYVQLHYEHFSGGEFANVTYTWRKNIIQLSFSFKY